ncbi:hypothetical protein F0267_26065 [Vibrio coralliilyticus]|uniref:hypothetical protein n=1 Tax=Vibrio TaxID=662 RepID=UPI00148E1E65|nr:MULTISPECIES: hypothetical protein [Vibrio]NOH26181.1 hypothetical protein [Vibrio europaeus]NOH41696.1 hypothetical protein [Vibrio coralliilyticus]
MFHFNTERARRKALFIRDQATEKALAPHDTQNPAKQDQAEAVKRPIRERGKEVERALKQSQEVAEFEAILKQENMI